MTGSSQIIRVAKIRSARKGWDLLSVSEKADIEEEMVYNGCGGKGGVSFEKILNMVDELDYFDKEKFKKFHRELTEQCNKHDYRYWLGGTWFHKAYADIALSSWIFWNLRWSEWFIPPTLGIASLVGLTRKGNRYFNFS